MCIYIYTSVCITPRFTAKNMCQCETGQDDGDSCWQGQMVNPT